MALFAFQMAEPSAKRKKTLDVSYYEMIYLDPLMRIARG